MKLIRWAWHQTLKLWYKPRLAWHQRGMKKSRKNSDKKGTIEHSAWYYHYHANNFLLKKWEYKLIGKKSASKYYLK